MLRTCCERVVYINCPECQNTNTYCGLVNAKISFWIRFERINVLNGWSVSNSSNSTKDKVLWDKNLTWSAACQVKNKQLDSFLLYYSRVRNNHSPMFIKFLTFFQRLWPYSRLHRAYFISISIRYKWGYPEYNRWSTP